MRLEDTPIKVDAEGHVLPAATPAGLAYQLQVLMSDLQLNSPALYAQHRDVLEGTSQYLLGHARGATLEISQD